MEITIEQLKALLCGEVKNRPLTTGSECYVHPFEIGQNYFIRTVTHNHTGRLVAVYPTELVLEDAAWIADSGRFMNAIRDGTLNEVEPFPDGEKVIIGRSAIIDAVKFSKALPRSQK